MKICSICNKELSLSNYHKHSKGKDGRHSTCKDCRSKYMEEYNKLDRSKQIAREASNRFNKRNPERIRFYRKYNNAILNKTLSKPSKCNICGDENSKIQGHHDDYTKPLQVVWCCEKCHYKIHDEIRNNSIKNINRPDLIKKLEENLWDDNETRSLRGAERRLVFLHNDFIKKLIELIDETSTTLVH